MPLKKHTNLRTEQLKTHVLKTPYHSKNTRTYELDNSKPHALKNSRHSKKARTYKLNNSKTHALKILKFYNLFYKTLPASQPLLAKIWVVMQVNSHNF